MRSERILLQGSNRVYQVGDLKFSLSLSLLDGWLICDGSEVSRETYNDLFDCIGVTFGEGNGETTFNLPDLRHRFIEGQEGDLGAFIEAGLPNITGNFWNAVVNYKNTGTWANGVFRISTVNVAGADGGSSNLGRSIDMNAVRASSVYGGSNTVQPNSITTNILIKY